MTDEQKAQVVEYVLLSGRPQTPEHWEILRTLPRDTLKRIGLGSWDGRLMLFPKEWYEHIPKGYMVEDISEGVEPFEPGVTDGDYRAGFLTYGVPAVDGVVEQDTGED